jgi:hypothetical protein
MELTAESLLIKEVLFATNQTTEVADLQVFQAL